MDIKIKTNSKQVNRELADVQKQTVKTSSVINSANVSNENSFNNLNKMISLVNDSYGKFGATVTAAIAQVNMMSAAMNIMNQTASVSFMQVEAMNALITVAAETMNAYSETIAENSFKLLENTAGIYSNLEAVALHQQALLIQKEIVDTLNITVEALSATVGLLSEIITANSGTLGENQTQTEGNETAVTNNMLALLEAISAIKESSEQIQKNTVKTEENADNTDKLILVKQSLAFYEGILGAITAFNSGLTFAKTLADMASRNQSKQNVIQNNKETASNSAKAASGMAGIISTGIPGIAIALAAVATLGVVLGIMKASVAAMATGGVVSAPTVALVGEGRYPEAVVPLGSSPQFSSMKSDIANAVLHGINALSRNQTAAVNTPLEIVLNLDGEKFARAVIPQIDREHRRKGYTLVLKEV